ncbi:hypothetical protein C3K47_06810 [Solitalea longa]|uniref:Uncharacterized protein n=1 Tax=Solitalea longa TaxID=2079460 RepID=A0A2S5A5A6_9SPHI|nr:hypothetical protein [Solitalea longa]POY37467.1 hypothetical protein C3K47_06810 [Solitalea longa]
MTLFEGFIFERSALLEYHHPVKLIPRLFHDLLLNTWVLLGFFSVEFSFSTLKLGVHQFSY